MDNKSGKTDKKPKKTALQGAEKGITKTNDKNAGQKNSIENKMNNCKS
ncbi:MAG: hypothetical protein GYA50_09210 [Eubacteriaceae bacterium]|nr:hypothetical protein [Eubacteriaceae bacterium]